MKRTYLLVIGLIALMLLGVLACQPPAPEQPAGENGDQTATQPDNTAAVAEEGEMDPGMVVSEEDGTMVITGEDGETIITTTEGDGTINVNDGETVVTISQEAPEGWPEEIPLMPGFEIIQGGEEETGGHGGGMVLSLGGNGSFDEITEFYMDIPGWTKEDMPFNPLGEEGTMMVYHKGDNEQLTITGLKSQEEDDGYDVIVTLAYTDD